MRLQYLLVAAGLVAIFNTAAARAAYIVDVVQSGSDVTFTGSGSFDLAGLKSLYPAKDAAQIAPRTSTLILGSAFSEDLYAASISGPASFGSGVSRYAGSSAGPTVGFNLLSGLLAVPAGYMSGEELGPSTATFAGASLESLGLTSGSYAYTLRPEQASTLAALDANNTITLNISTVPLPASAPMFGVALLGLAGLGFAAKRRKAAAAA